MIQQALDSRSQLLFRGLQIGLKVTSATLGLWRLYLCRFRLSTDKCERYHRNLGSSTFFLLSCCSRMLLRPSLFCRVTLHLCCPSLRGGCALHGQALRRHLPLGADALLRVDLCRKCTPLRLTHPRIGMRLSTLGYVDVLCNHLAKRRKKTRSQLFRHYVVDRKMRMQ